MPTASVAPSLRAEPAKTAPVPTASVAPSLRAEPAKKAPVPIASTAPSVRAEPAKKPSVPTASAAPSLRAEPAKKAPLPTASAAPSPHAVRTQAAVTPPASAARAYRGEPSKKVIISNAPPKAETRFDPTGPSARKARRSSVGPTRRRAVGPRQWALWASLLVLGLVVVATVYPATVGTPGTPLRGHFDRLHRAIASAFRTTPTALPEVKSAPRLIELRIVADSPNSRLYFDGHEVSNPLRITYPADESLHEIRVEAPGQTTRIHRTKLNRDISVMFGF